MKIRLFTVPNIITLANLLCGAGAIVAAVVYGDFTLSFILIAAAALCDFLDGFTARLLHQYSAIGVQLDSLADMVSFGAAPAMIFYALYNRLGVVYEWSGAAVAVGQYIPFIIAAFSALRLAKFNIDEEQHEEFSGLTTTANAIFCSSLAMLAAQGEMTLSKEWLLVISLIMASLLISPIRMFSFKMKSFGWTGNRLRYSFLAVCVAAIALLQLRAIPLVTGLYIVISTVRWSVQSRGK